MDLELGGKKAVITGGSRGIGKSIAMSLAKEGVEVSICSRSMKALKSAAREIELETSQKVFFSEADTTSMESVNDFIEFSATSLGGIDILINNAGIPPRENTEQKILMVNYIGMKTFLDGMIGKLNRGASIVNTSSRAGSMWQENLKQVKRFMQLGVSELSNFVSKENIDPVRAYNLSKEAVNVLTISRTEELLAKGLRINSVCPAAVSTDILQDFTNAFGEKVVKNIAKAGRPALPEEIADLILYLISPESGWVKGQNITIDGGMSAIITSDILNLN